MRSLEFLPSFFQIHLKCMKVKQIKMDATLGPKKMCYLPRAAFAAALATLGSTTEAKNATVDITGFPC